MGRTRARRARATRPPSLLAIVQSSVKSPIVVGSVNASHAPLDAARTAAIGGPFPGPYVIVPKSAAIVAESTDVLKLRRYAAYALACGPTAKPPFVSVGANTRYEFHRPRQLLGPSAAV